MCCPSSLRLRWTAYHLTLTEPWDWAKHLPPVGHDDGLVAGRHHQLHGESHGPRAERLCSLAPLPRESGTSLRGRPRLGHGGHRRLRTALFLATLSAARYNPTIKVYYDRLRAAGKPSKVARCAAARKLLQLARAVVIHKQAYDPHYHRNQLGYAQPH